MSDLFNYEYKHSCRTFLYSTIEDNCPNATLHELYSLFFDEWSGILNIRMKLSYECVLDI